MASDDTSPSRVTVKKQQITAAASKQSGAKAQQPKALPAAPPSPSTEDWLRNLIQTSQQGSFFTPCLAHTALKKNEATLFCVDCDSNPGCCRAMCQHCVPAHASHRSIQIRRYVYCDVVRASDISPFVDIGGIQSYTINQAKVVFVNHRPQAKQLQPGAQEGCAVCSRALREGCTYCSLRCKVEALVQEGRLGPAAVTGGASAGAGAAAMADAAAAWGCVGADSPSAAPVAGPSAVDAAAVASDSSDCCTLDASKQRGGGICQQQRRPMPPGPAAAAAEAAWDARRSSDGSCQSYLDCHTVNSHVCRRKQPSPRRSPLL